jgi:mRNA interferase MazF
VLVISHDIFNERSGTVIALPLTSRSQRAGLPLTLRIESLKLPKPSWAKVSQARVLSTDRIGKPLGRVSPEELNLVIEGLFELVAYAENVNPRRRGAGLRRGLARRFFAAIFNQPFATKGFDILSVR